MKTDEMNNMIQEMDQELKEILMFWADHSLDTVRGGFIGETDRAGDKKEDADKGAVLNARLLWTFSSAYNFYRDKKYLDLADRAYDYLMTYFWDKKNGGLYWAVDSKGEVSNKRKQAYAQGFGIYGLSEYYKASGKKEALESSIELYQLIEKFFKDDELGGYIEALDDDWTPLEDMRLSLKDANEPKSMNTHLHIIEPYTNLYRMWPDADLKKRIQHLLEVFRDHIINQETAHFHLFFDMDWTIKSEIVSYGHDIEGAWLLTEAAHEIQDEELLSQMKEIGKRMVDITIKEGMDSDGSVFYEKEDGHLDTDKHWWPQAEAMVGLMDVYQNTGDIAYLEAIQKVWVFIKSYVKDKEYGEWFGKVKANGQPVLEDCKIGFWKCPYHNSRALLEVINRLKTINN
nr:AGE family epimerase/isomerase [uncultured Carboxylicivirga sp.]